MRGKSYKYKKETVFPFLKKGNTVLFLKGTICSLSKGQLLIIQRVDNKPCDQLGIIES